MQIRLQKIIAMMGVASRRKAEELILSGRVSVNGKLAMLGMKADPHRDHIKIDGKILTKPEPKVYIAFYKPRGVITSLSDPEGRPTIMDFLKGVRGRVFPVGRLDYDTEGLLLLTNDGELAHSITHPSNKVPKTYLAKIKGLIDDTLLRKLSRGIELDDGITLPAKIKRLKQTENNSWLEVTLYEGRKRQIRRMFESVGHPVLKLKRISINGIFLGDLKAGVFRYLRDEEIRHLKSL